MQKEFMMYEARLVEVCVTFVLQSNQTNAMLQGINEQIDRSDRNERSARANLGHVMMLAELGQIGVELFDTLLVSFKQLRARARLFCHFEKLPVSVHDFH